jgi:phosphoribosyl-ATP pyrophosphohydrolase
MTSSKSVGKKAPESVLDRLAETLAARKTADPETSYVARLYREGLDTILKKVGEEAAETLLAAKDGERGALVHEVADLWFHTLVLLTYQGLSPRDVTAELDRRFGVSGLVEKATRDRGNRT